MLSMPNNFVLDRNNFRIETKQNVFLIHSKEVHIKGDPRGASVMHAPSGSRFLHFYAVFSKCLKNNPILKVGSPSRGKVFDPPLHMCALSDLD